MKRPMQSPGMIAGIAVLGAALIGSYMTITNSHASNTARRLNSRPP